ncbi:phytanoyl-CoA dioxygenase family protein [Nocardia sp. NPDC003999]
MCRAIVSHFESTGRPAPVEWWKGHAVSDRFVFDIATCDEILSWVKAILGPSITLWGAEYIRRVPGQEHAWHSDIETLQSPRSFVSVWVGLHNTTERSGLKFIAGSHLLGKSIQQIAFERQVPRAGLAESEVLAWAQEISSQAFIGQPEVGDGDAIFFAGGIWHTSLNRTENVRAALLLQYATPDVPIEILDFDRLEWPFRFTDVRAPSVLVSGGAEDSPQDIRGAPLHSDAGSIDDSMQLLDTATRESTRCAPWPPESIGGLP